MGVGNKVRSPAQVPCSAAGSEIGPASQLEGAAGGLDTFPSPSMRKPCPAVLGDAKFQFCGVDLVMGINFHPHFRRGPPEAPSPPSSRVAMSTTQLSRSSSVPEPSPSLIHPHPALTYLKPYYLHRDLVGPTQHPPSRCEHRTASAQNPACPHHNSQGAITQANHPQFAGALKALSQHQEHPLAHILSFHPPLFQQLSLQAPFCSYITICNFIVHLALGKKDLHLIKPSGKMYLGTKTKPVKQQPLKSQL